MGSPWLKKSKTLRISAKEHGVLTNKYGWIWNTVDGCEILHQLVDGKHPTYSLWWFIPYSISYHRSYHLFPTGAGFRNHRSWPWGLTPPATTFTFPIINSSCHFTWQELAPLLVPLHHGAEKIKATFQDFGVCIATGLASFGDNVGDLGRYWGDIVAIYDGV
jgi:hypothetical protein